MLIISSIAVDSFFFFDKLEKSISSYIPEILRNILIVNDIDCVSVLAEVNKESVESTEQFMRNEISSDMIPESRRGIY